MEAALFVSVNYFLLFCSHSHVLSTKSICYNTTDIQVTVMVGGNDMSTSVLKMYVSFVGMGLLVIAICLILFSRYKLSGWLAGIIATIAYICLIIGSIIIFFIVVSGPAG